LTHKHTTPTRLARIERALHRIEHALNISTNMEIEQMIDLSRIIQEVSETRGVAASTKALVTKLKAKIEELAGQVSDPADQQKINELAAELGVANDEIAAAVAENPDTGGSTGGVVG
jgi:threonine synthase